MIRQTALATTLALALAAGATTALAQPTTAQAAQEARKAAQEAQYRLQAAVSAQFDASALEELAQKAEAQYGLQAALSDQQARDVQLKVEQLAATADRLGAGGENTEQFNYQRGLAELDAGKWQAAVDAFNRVIKAGGAKADGATYWKAYAQNRLGQRSEALATLDALLKKSPNSRWAGDAKALQLEVRQAVGRPVTPEQESDEELKLLAIRGLLNTDAERALPMLEGLLQSNAAPKLKDQALFVLGMSESPKAREILVSVAKGRGNPDLQLAAIKYLGFRNAEQNRPILVDIYKSTTDVDVKRRVIEALSSASGPYGYALSAYYDAAGDYRVAARTTTQAAKASAAAAAVQNALWNLYQSETELKLKEQMVRALAMAQSEKVMELARAEKNQELRETAIQSLGMMKSPKTGEFLMSLYKDEKDGGLKKAIIRGLYTQRNATALVQIAREETDPAVKKDVVEKLSTMKDKEAVDYMIELLKK
jgi:tetratricopeptide (TPR) repeat protein